MRLIEIPDDGIVSEYIWAGDSVTGIRRIDLSYLPTIEAEPVRHSRWFEMVESVEDGHTGEYYEEVYYNCLNCDYATGDKTPYCPYCGCKMDKED